jgi:ligand-binding sensor domain-containing protein
LYQYDGNVIKNYYQQSKQSEWRKRMQDEPGVALPGLAHPRVNSIVMDGPDALWVACDGGLYNWRDGAFRSYLYIPGLSSSTYKAVTRARNGDIWVTVPPAGVARLREGRWMVFQCGKGTLEFSPPGGLRGHRRHGLGDNRGWRLEPLQGRTLAGLFHTRWFGRRFYCRYP